MSYLIQKAFQTIANSVKIVYEKHKMKNVTISSEILYQYHREFKSQLEVIDKMEAPNPTTKILNKESEVNVQPMIFRKKRYRRGYREILLQAQDFFISTSIFLIYKKKLLKIPRIHNKISLVSIDTN